MWIGGGKQGRVSRTFVPGPGFQGHLLSLAPEYLVSSSPGVSMEKCGLQESTGPGVLKESIQHTHTHTHHPNSSLSESLFPKTVKKANSPHCYVFDQESLVEGLRILLLVV